MRRDFKQKRDSGGLRQDGSFIHRRRGVNTFPDGFDSPACLLGRIQILSAVIFARRCRPITVRVARLVTMHAC